MFSLNLIIIIVDIYPFPTANYTNQNNQTHIVSWYRIINYYIQTLSSLLKGKYK